MDILSIYKHRAVYDYMRQGSTSSYVFPQLTEHILLFLGAHVKSSYIRVQCDMLVFETSPPTHTHTSSFDYPFLLF